MSELLNGFSFIVWHLIAGITIGLVWFALLKYIRGGG